MQKNHYLPVNWIDGMKINKTQLIAQEIAIVYQLAQNTSCLLNELNYGILPVSNERAALKLLTSTDNHCNIQVWLQRCSVFAAAPTKKETVFLEINKEHSSSKIGVSCNK